MYYFCKYMTSLNHKIIALSKLGKILSDVAHEKTWSGYSLGINKDEYSSFIEAIKKAKYHNGWFSYDMVLFALLSWSKSLTVENIKFWLSKYQIKENNQSIAIICAGNIPMVSFHDILCSYLCGMNVQVKLSSSDNVLIPELLKILANFDEEVLDNIVFTDKVSNFNKVIATGSNNTSRYFNEYFAKYPNIIRKNRTSIAIIDGSESKEDLVNLSKDIFLYYGLGCRNITKLYLPLGYELDNIFAGLYNMKDVIYNNKYANNYDYYKAIFLLEDYDIIENGFIILKEDNSIFSPIGTLYYQYYNNKNELNEILNENKKEIQCIVGRNYIPFGLSQEPKLWDYSDNIDTINFLNK